MPPKNYKLADFRVEYDYTPYTFAGGIKTEITDYKLTITQELIGARIVGIKIQDDYILTEYLIPNGFENRYLSDNPNKINKTHFDKEKVITESVKVTYGFNELRIEFDLNSEYTVKHLAMGVSNNEEEKVFVLNYGQPSK